MKKLVLLAAALVAMPTFAQSAKFSLNISDATLVKETTDQAWTKILATEIRTSQQKDLIMNVSMEAGLYTDTLVSSRKLAQADASAKATVRVRVLVDGNVASPALPGEVIFAEREQYLMAQFAGLFECTDLNGDGVMNFGECEYTDPEVLQLWQRTVNANAFTFALTDLQSGIHTVQVQAQVVTVTKDMVATADASSVAKASAWVGKGTVTVEEVRLVKDQDPTSQIVF